MAGKKRAKSSKFLLGLNIYSSLLLFVAGIALVVLWIFLSRYQQELDTAAAEEAAREAKAAYELAVSRAPQLAFEDYVAAADAQTWTDSWYAANPDNYDDPEQIRALMEERFSDPELEYWKAPDYSDESPRYVIKKGGEDLAYLTLSGSGLDWSVTETEVLLEGGEESSVVVPEGCTVLCNGREVKPSAEAEPRLFDMEAYSDLIVDPVRWEGYTVVGKLSKPILKVEAPAGRKVSTAQDGTMFYVLSDDEAQEYQNRAERFIYALLFYYMNGNYNTSNNMWGALNHVASNSQAFKLIRDSYDGVIWDTYYPYVSYSTEAGEVRVLASNCLMVDVAYHTEGTYGEYTNVADGTYRVYFLDQGYGYGIYCLAYV